MSTLSFRPFLPRDAERLAELFRVSIEELTQEHYDADQRAAWASFADDLESFGDKLGAQLTILAERAGAVVGFVSLKGADHLDMLYVDAGHAGTGIGKALCEVIEILAAKRGAKTLLVDASDAALEFFDTRQYEPLQRNTTLRAGEWLANTTMKKTLAAPSEVQ